MNATYDFDKVLDRTKERSKTWDFRTLKPGAIPMNGAETHFECPAPVRKVIHDVADWPIYGYPYFTDDFVNAAAGYMKRQHGWDCDPKWIEFVGGFVPGIAFAIQAVTAVGDKVLINSPAYSPFRSTVEMNDRVLVESMLNITPEEVTFDWEDMERKFSDPAVKAFILCDPHNPTGKSCTAEELARIDALAEKYGVFVIVDEVHAEVLPEDKAAFIRNARAQGHTVIMIGDGVNDSPALSEADVGIAISTGAAIAQEIADITVSSEDLRALVTLRQLSVALMARIRWNYRFIIGFNCGLIGLGLVGILPPTTSALLHNMSTLGISVKSMTNLL